MRCRHINFGTLVPKTTLSRDKSYLGLHKA